MTRPTRHDATEALQHVFDQLAAEPWFKKVQIAPDDGGWCVEVKVDPEKYKQSEHYIPAAVGSVRVITLL